MKTVKLFKNGHSQAVRLPKEFRFEGDKVYIFQEGDEVLLSPYKNPWERFLKSLDMFRRLRARLERTPTPIGPLDTPIAAHALSPNRTLIIDNVSEFGRIPGLKLGK